VGEGSVPGAEFFLFETKSPSVNGGYSFLVSSLFELSDGSGVFLYGLRLYVDQEVHVTAGQETGATIHG
jgi:hypothetical protein